jgi:hypothetical protein
VALEGSGGSDEKVEIEVEVLGAADAAAAGDRVAVAPAAGGPAPRIFRSSSDPTGDAR